MLARNSRTILDRTCAVLQAAAKGFCNQKLISMFHILCCNMDLICSGFLFPRPILLFISFYYFYYSSEYMVKNIHKFSIKKPIVTWKELLNISLLFSSFFFLSLLHFLFIKSSQIVIFPWVISKFSMCSFNYGM